MAEELMVVLKRSENLGFGFSLLGTTGLPHVIYDIVENSPAAECGKVEAGDIIVKVNGTDVHRFTTKEVLKCLRLSQDPVTLELKRDPKIKAHVRKYLAQTSNQHYSDVPPFVLDDINELSTSPNNRVTSPINLTSPLNQQQRPHGACHRISSSDPISRPSRIPTAKGVGVRSPLAPTSATSSVISKSAPQSPHGINSKRNTSHIPTSNGTNNNYGGNNQILPPPNKARSEAYMMTGDLILNLSRTPQSSGLITSHSKKIDSLRDSPTRVATRRNGSIAPTAKCDSIPSSPTYSDTESISSLKTIGENSTEKDNSVTNNSDSNSIKLIKNNKQNLLKNNNYTCDLMNTENNIPSGCAVSSLSSSAVKNKINDFKLSEWNSEVDGGGVGGSGLLYHGDGDNIDHSVSASNVDSGLVNTNNIDNLSIKNLQTNVSSVSSSSSATVKSELISSPDPSFSVPTSPTSLSTPLIEGLTITKHKETANSVPTSPESSAQEIIRRSNQQHNGVVRKCDAAGFRTSKSEDHLQATQRDGGLGAVVPIDIDEDVNSSLNTLLDTRHDCDDSQNSDRDRIVWTYNAPIVPTTQGHTGGNSSNSHSSSISSSPQRSGSPASPTSVSSSVMSSNSGSKGGGMNSGFHNLMCPINGDQSVSEAVSNISSPDYQDDDNLLSSRDMAAMAISDPSDSDSTILVSDAHHHVGEREHRIVIQVKGAENQSNHGYTELKDSEDELATLTEEPPTVVIGGYDGRESSPPISDDGSDVESLHSYHYSPKAVDIPSAVRLAKRLYGLDGFKKSDVSRHLSKNNDFSRAVADEYLKYFNFDKISLDAALRQFLQQFSLSGETQERERVLVHFSKRYLDCNPCTFNSQDAVHTLTCAIMLLNTDLHGQNIGRKMTCAEFIDNLAELNDGENFPKDILKCLYQAIKNHPLEWALDEDSPDQPKSRGDNSLQGPPVGPNPFLEAPQNVAAIEYKKGYVMRKCCYDSNYKKTPFGKRSWKMFYCTLRDLVLYLHKDEHGFRKNSMSDNVHNAIRIHHGLATKAQDYTKKQHVFRLQTADQAEYLFQTSDSKELQSWIDTINYVCAQFSAPPLEGGVGSQKRFQRPLLPSSHTKLLLRDQLAAHEERVNLLEMALMVHKSGVIPTKGLPLQNYKEKETYLNYELKRYKTYVYILSARMGAEQAEFMMNNEIVGDSTSPNFLQHSLNLQNTAANIVVAAAAAAAAAQASAAAAAATGQSLSPIGCMPTIIAGTTMASSTTSTTITGNTTMTSINSAGANQLQNIGVLSTQQQQQQQGSCLQQQQQQQQQQHATNRVIEAKFKT